MKNKLEWKQRRASIDRECVFEENRKSKKRPKFRQGVDKSGAPAVRKCAPAFSHYTRFGASYHTTLPSHWAQQFLGLNLTNLLSNHIHRALQKIQTHHHSRSRPTPNRNSYQPVVGRTFRTISYTS
jgi:hypothetical protein